MSVLRAVPRLVLKAGHLVARFVTSLPPTPPNVEDEVWADAQLLPAERALWVRMDNRDRRHSVSVARRFVRRLPHAARPEVAGALLHDVGKIECRLGTLGRVVATLVGPRTERFAAYHAHEEIGAEMAESAGAHPATVELIRGAGPLAPILQRCDHA